MFEHSHRPLQNGMGDTFCPSLNKFIFISLKLLPLDEVRGAGAA